MVYRGLSAGPASLVAEERRGRVVGRFCKACGGVYPLHSGAHRGKPAHGKDHVAAPCSHEGEPFSAGETWWEPAVEVLAPPPPPESAAE